MISDKDIKHQSDKEARRSKNPIVCYEVESLPPFDEAFYQQAKDGMEKVSQILIPPKRWQEFQSACGAFLPYCQC